MKPIETLKTNRMVVIARPILREFMGRYPFSANPLNEWYFKTKTAEWTQYADVRNTWNSCDAIGNDRYVFNIAGNNYRLIAMIHFKKRTLYIRKVLTHEEYTDFSRKGILETL